MGHPVLGRIWLMVLLIGYRPYFRCGDIISGHLKDLRAFFFFLIISLFFSSDFLDKFLLSF